MGVAKRIAFISTFAFSVYWDSGDLLDSAVMVAIVYGIFEILNLIVKAWIKRKRKEAKDANP